MKWNKYNLILANENRQYILYNCQSDKIAVFVEEIKNMIDENIKSADNIKAIHPDLYAYLVDNNFIVENYLNEFEVAKEAKHKQVASDESFEVTINPTLNCNLRCWYCYEEHKADSYVKEETFEAIKSLLKRKTEEAQIKNIDLSFFGGEPLLKFKSTMKPLIDYAKELCASQKKKLKIRITTNAVLLTKSVVDELHASKLGIYIQAAFDGDKQTHNLVKKDAKGKGMYDIMVENVKYGISQGLQINIRCNYTLDSIASFKHLITEFSDCVSNSANFYFSFQKVWQADDDDKIITSQLQILEKLMEQKGIKYNKKGPMALADICYADRANNIVVNYDGNIYKCTARDFTEELKEGVLTPDGNVTYNERYQDRMEAILSYEACLDCIAYPICTLCSQKKLDQLLDTHCPMNFSEEDKHLLIKERLKAISSNNIVAAHT